MGTGLGCLSTTTPDTKKSFDCVRGRLSAWSKDKQDFCCLFRGIGCPHTFVSMANKPYDCKEYSPTSQQNWTVTQKEWCCSHKAVGCPLKFEQHRLHLFHGPLGLVCSLIFLCLVPFAPSVCYAAFRACVARPRFSRRCQSRRSVHTDGYLSVEPKFSDLLR